MRKNIEHTNYLDVGCGYGVNSSIFGRDFNNVICLDFNLSSKKVKECRSRIGSKGNKNLFFVRFPNKYFFMELHTGLPAYFLIPSFIKPWFLRKIGYKGLLEINIPTIREIKKIIEDLGVSVEIRKSKVIYPIKTIPQGLRWVYTILKRIKVLNLVPLGWMVCIRKSK